LATHLNGWVPVSSSAPLVREKGGEVAEQAELIHVARRWACSYGDLVYDYGYGDYGENTPYNPFFYYDYVDSERVDEEVSLPADTVQLCHTTDGVTYYNGACVALDVWTVRRFTDLVLVVERLTWG
jgi:hypothetical protein